VFESPFLSLYAPDAPNDMFMLGPALTSILPASDALVLATFLPGPTIWKSSLSDIKHTD
jgi:hypothetical protein